MARSPILASPAGTQAVPYRLSIFLEKEPQRKITVG